MAVIENSFRQKLDAGAPTIGTHFMLADPDVPELIGDSGAFDYAEFVAEYSSFDMTLLSHLARSAQCGNLPLMIKLDQAGQAFWAQAALGAGFKSVLFTDIRTPDDVVRAHQSVRADAPGVDGHMGVKLRRPALAGYNPSRYGTDLDSIVTLIMIEKDVAFQDLDAILTVARDLKIDMTQWGPADFSFSRGQPELMGTDEIREIEETVIRKSIEYGVAPRIEIGAVEQAPRYLDLGVRHFCIGWDRFVVQSGLAALGKGLRTLIDEA